MQIREKVMDDRLITLLAEVFDLRSSDISEAMGLQEISHWDSLTHMDLISNLEAEYNIRLTMEDIVEMTTVKRIISILKNYGIHIHA